MNENVEFPGCLRGHMMFEKNVIIIQQTLVTFWNWLTLLSSLIAAYHPGEYIRRGTKAYILGREQIWLDRQTQTRGVCCCKKLYFLAQL